MQLRAMALRSRMEYRLTNLAMLIIILVIPQPHCYRFQRPSSRAHCPWNW